MTTISGPGTVSVRVVPKVRADGTRPSESTDAKALPLPTGASTVKDVNKAPLTGDYHLLPGGTKLPNGLGVVADGKDVIPSSPHAQYIIQYSQLKTCQ